MAGNTVGTDKDSLNIIQTKVKLLCFCSSFINLFLFFKASSFSGIAFVKHEVAPSFQWRSIDLQWKTASNSLIAPWILPEQVEKQVN